MFSDKDKGFAIWTNWINDGSGWLMDDQVTDADLEALMNYLQIERNRGQAPNN